MNGIPRSPSAKRHVDIIDILRGAAALWVLVYHCLGSSFGMDALKWGGWFRDFSAPLAFLTCLPISFGWAGVAMFFAISGFCIHLSFSSQKEPSFREFFAKRFFRIYPPYLVALLFFAFIFGPTRISLADEEGLLQVVSHVLLVHNFDSTWFYGINAVFWSIAVECQIYLLYPLLILAVRRFGWRQTLVVLAAFEIAMRGVLGGYHAVVGDVVSLPLSQGLPLLFCFSWSLGAAAADAYLKDRPLPFSSHSVTLWIGAAVISDFVKPLAGLSWMFFSIATVVFIGAHIRRSQDSSPQDSLSRRLFISAGKYSYSIYLLHLPFVSGPLKDFVAKTLPGAASYPLLLFSGLVVVSSLVTLPAAMAFYRYVELPSIALGRHFLKKREATRRSTEARLETSSRPKAAMPAAAVVEVSD